MTRNLISAIETIAWGGADAGCGCFFVHSERVYSQFSEAVKTREPQHVNTCMVQYHSSESLNYQSAVKAACEGSRTITVMNNKGVFSIAAEIYNTSLENFKAGILLFAITENQIKQYDPRLHGKWALIPVIEPASLQEIYDSIEYGFLLSENLRCPVMYSVSSKLLQALSGVSHSRKKNKRPPVFQSFKGTIERNLGEIIPSSANYLNIMTRLTKISIQSQFNRYVIGSNRSLGIIAFGYTFNMVKELKQTDDIEFPILKISQYPLPDKWVRKIFTECREVLVLEEGLPIYEELLRGFFDNEQIKGRLDRSLPDGSMISVLSLRKILGLKD